MNTSVRRARPGSRVGLQGCRAVLFSTLILSLSGFEPARLRAAPGEKHFGEAWLINGLSGAPLCFELNRGQAEGGFGFVARGPECLVLLAPTEAKLILGKAETSSSTLSLGRFTLRGEEDVRTRSVHLRLENANPHPTLEGLGELPGKVNYYVGQDPSAWRSGIPLFSRVQVDEVYPGVRLVYYADASARLEYDFLIQPGAKPDRICLDIEGADKVGVDPAGNLVLKVGDAEIRQHEPVIYQMVQGARQPIRGGYRVKRNAEVGFWLGEYDRRLPLVIDPVLDFAGYVGGTSSECGWGIAVDGRGNVWIAGETLSNGLRTTATAPTKQYQGGRNGFGDGFVARFSNGTNLNYLTYLGGSGHDAAFAIAVDTNTGAAFVTGYTDSPNFPIYPASGAVRAFQTHLSGTNLNIGRIYPIDAFVTKLRSDGTLAYSTYLGGSGRDVGMGIAADNLGRAYVTGYTESSDFPTVQALHGQYRHVAFRYKTNDPSPGYVTAYRTAAYDGRRYQSAGSAFVARLNTSGTALGYSTFLGGSSMNMGQGIAVDSNYCAYVVGITSSRNFPTTNAWSFLLNGQTNNSTAADGFISKLSPSGSSLVYSTYLGGNHRDIATAVTVDAALNAYVTGYTHSTNFPVTLTNFTAWLSSTNLNPDVFVVKLDPDGSTNNGYSVVFGGRGIDQGLGIAVDQYQEAFIVGLTASTTNFAGVETALMTNFFNSLDTNAPPTFSPTNSSLRGLGSRDTFIVELAPSGTNLFSAFLGGNRNDKANGIALDTTTTTNVIVYIVGTSSSTRFPGTSPSILHRNGGLSDAFVARIVFPPEAAAPAPAP